MDLYFFVFERDPLDIPKLWMNHSWVQFDKPVTVLRFNQFNIGKKHAEKNEADIKSF